AWLLIGANRGGEAAGVASRHRREDRRSRGWADSEKRKFFSEFFEKKKSQAVAARLRRSRGSEQGRIGLEVVFRRSRRRLPSGVFPVKAAALVLITVSDIAAKKIRICRFA
ncbi:hypothetical protein U1Q18_042028, partial [Sarracenia purpurea var. burkii]